MKEEDIEGQEVGKELEEVKEERDIVHKEKENEEEEIKDEDIEGQEVGKELEEVEEERDIVLKDKENEEEEWRTRTLKVRRLERNWRR